MKKEKKGLPADKILFIIGVALLAFAAVYGGWQKIGADKTRRQYEELRAIAKEDVGEHSDAAEKVSAEPALPAYISPYEELFAMNDSMKAWLCIPGTNIDYPVMHTPNDEEFYLYHDFYCEENKNGCLILAAAANMEKPSTNLLIHGHNMRSGEMFGELDKYQDEEYANQHKEVILYTRTGERRYQVVAAFIGKVLKEGEDGFRYYRFFDAKTPEALAEYCGKINEVTLYHEKMSVEPEDHLLTLSTCHGSNKATRFIVVAKQVK